MTRRCSAGREGSIASMAVCSIHDMRRTAASFICSGLAITAGTSSGDEGQESVRQALVAEATFKRGKTGRCDVISRRVGVSLREVNDRGKVAIIAGVFSSPSPGVGGTILT